MSDSKLQKDLKFYSCLIQFIEYRVSKPEQLSFSSDEIMTHAGDRYKRVIDHLIEKGYAYIDIFDSSRVFVAELHTLDNFLSEAKD